MGEESVSLYIHIPFCRAKCAYCSFNSYQGLEHLKAPYVQALVREIEGYFQPDKLKAITMYFGGGTPSLLSLEQLAELLAASSRAFRIEEGSEITLEANPGTIDLLYLKGLRKLGVNRLSLGVQSLDDRTLCILGRIHSAREALEAYGMARQAGFSNINLDLIYSLPTQTLVQWEDTLRRAILLEPDHLSLYPLTLEEDTPLAQRVARGELPFPDEDLAADMYLLAEEMLDAAGYEHYEISNWARMLPGCSCGELGYLASRHNLTYWRNEPYLGFGAGAHSYFGAQRYYNALSPAEYIVRLESGRSPQVGVEEIGEALEMAETMIMGLRLLEGIDKGIFQRRFGQDLMKTYGEEIEELIELGLIEMEGERMKLTPRGRLLGNEVFQRFLPS